MRARGGIPVSPCPVRSIPRQSPQPPAAKVECHSWSSLSLLLTQTQSLSRHTFIETHNNSSGNSYCWGGGEAHTESALVGFIIWNQITHFFQFYPLHVFRFPSSLNPGTHHLLPGLRQFVPSRPVSPPRIHTDRKSDRLTLGSDFPVALATSNMLDCVTFQ